MSQELALEVDVDGHVDGPGPDDAEPGGEVVERRRQHRRDAVAGCDAEGDECAGDALGPVANLRVREVAVDRAHRSCVAESLCAVVDQRGDDPRAVVSCGHLRDRTEGGSDAVATDVQPCRVDRVLTRRLGANGPEVSVVGLGANNFGWRIGLEESRAVVDAAADEGITLLDTADVYGATESEQFLGEILAGRRERFVVVTKFGHPVPDGPDLPRSSRAYLRWAIEGSLARLRTELVDVYMLHRPDGVTPIGETIDALGELVREGKARYIGVSNVDAAQIEEAAAVAEADGIPLVCVESRYSLIRRGIEVDVIPACERHGLGLLPYYPLESGLLTGKYRRGQAPPADSRFVGNAIRLAGRPLAHRRGVRRGRGARALRGHARRAAPRRRDRRPRGDAGGRLGDRRGDNAGTGTCERQGGTVAALCRSTARPSRRGTQLARHQANETVKPPSTTIVWPVT